jgi:hypothetical protein
VKSHRALTSIFGVALAFGCDASKAGTLGNPDGGSELAANAGSSMADAGSAVADAGSAVVDADSAVADASSGLERATVTVGAAGGTVSAGGALLSIPPGALAADTEITMSVSADPAPAGYAAYSPLYRFEPEGLAFAEPASISIPFAIPAGGDPDNPGSDPRLATIFWSRRGASGFERTAAKIAGGVATASVTHFSAGFAANGVAYADAPDPACARAVAIAQRPAGGQAAGLALVFKAEDCQGRPLAALGCAGASGCDFALSEDGVALDGVAPAALSKAGHQVFATLVLDVSSSMGPDLGLVIEGAKAFVTRLQLDLKLPAHIGIWALSGEGVVPIQDPTLDSQRLLAHLDALGAAGAKANDKVDLNAAVAQVLDRQAALQAELERRNRGGAFTTGYVVVVTGDADGGRSETLADIRANKALRPVTVATLPLDTGRVDPAALAAFADWSLPSSPDAATLYRDLSDLAGRIASSSKAVYALAYCSPQQSGKHSVAVRTRAASAGAAAEFVFSAEGFSGGCAPGQLAAPCAAGQQCGGTLCGACDDRTSICDGPSGTCVSQCTLMKNVCHGETGTNSLGYPQACEDRREATRCTDGGCVDLNTDMWNCGKCGNWCQTSCAKGECACGANEKWCSLSCVPILTSQAHCGDCNQPCAADQKCLRGLCKGYPEWANSPVPQEAPAQYEIGAGTVLDTVTGLTWQRQVPGEKMTQFDAVDYCANLDLAGPLFWRLPTRIELLSIVDIGHVKPAINNEAFPNTPSELFWTATQNPISLSPLSFFYVDFASGEAIASHPGTPEHGFLRVRCVR